MCWLAHWLTRLNVCTIVTFRFILFKTQPKRWVVWAYSKNSEASSWSFRPSIITWSYFHNAPIRWLNGVRSLRVHPLFSYHTSIYCLENVWLYVNTNETTRSFFIFLHCVHELASRILPRETQTCTYIAVLWWNLRLHVVIKWMRKTSTV